MQRAFSVGGVISESLSIFMKNLVPFTVLSFIVHVPWILWQFIVLDVTESPMWIMLIELSLSMLLNVFLVATLSYGVFKQMRGQPAGLGDCISVGFKRLIPVIGVALLTGLFIAGGFMLFVIPGVILACMWWVAAPAAVVENIGVSQAMSRSSALTSGNRGTIFLIMLLMGLLGGAVGGVIGFVMPATHEASLNDANEVVYSYSSGDPMPVTR